jgi:hypothetical protein
VACKTEGRCQMSKQAGWPKSKPVHAPENRTGQAWKAGSVQVMVEDKWERMKLIDIPAGHFQCRYCLNIVRIDERGCAACENCGYIYNEGQVVEPPKKSKISNREKKHADNNFRAKCQRKA